MACDDDSSNETTPPIEIDNGALDNEKAADIMNQLSDGNDLNEVYDYVETVEDTANDSALEDDSSFQESQEEVVFYGPEDINVESCEIPDGTTRIAKEAFRGCANLRHVNIPNSVRAIDDSAFLYSGLVDVTLPSNLESLGESVFCQCNSLEHVSFTSNILRSTGKNTFNLCTSLKQVDLVEGLEEIGSMTFLGCSSLEIITIPSSVTKIGTSAFAGCSSLSNLVLPSNLAEIEMSAFSECRQLDLTLPKSIQTLGRNPFYGTHSVKVPREFLNYNGIDENGFKASYAYIDTEIEAID